MKPIVKTPNEILTTPAKNVVKIDGRVLSVIGDLKDTLIQADNPKGVGLAAPQIGLALRIFLIRPAETDSIRVFINPQFSAKSKTLVKGLPDNKLEGCLSVPKVWGVVTRHTWIKLSYLNEAGETQTEKFTGFAAIIIQHEMDHLDGILFTWRVLEQKGQLYKPGIDENGKEILEPLEI